MKFNETIKTARISRRLGLREFCSQLGLDPSNWSKVERGVNPPPRDVAILSQVADLLEISGAQRQELFDAASLARNELPSDILEREGVVSKLPAFFRAMRGEEPDETELASMIDDIRALYRADPE